MEWSWYRQDRAAVLAGLAGGERPQLATTMAAGAVDELLALHEELGILTTVGALSVERERDGLPDPLLLRTLAALPFVEGAALTSAAGALFREPALLLRLGWAPVQLRSGANGRYRHPAGRQPESLPCHPETLRDALRRVSAASWEQAQRTGVRALYERGLIRGTVYGIDGSGLGPGLRLVSLVCVSAERPTIVAWRVLEGTASEKGQEAAVTRALVEQALELGGPGCIELLLADALYADGPLLAWLKYAKGIDALVRLPADRRLYAEARCAVQLDQTGWSRHQYVRTVSGKKALRTVEASAAGELSQWDSFTAAAATHGAAGATLWVALIRAVAPPDAPAEELRALVSTRAWPDGFAAYQAYRPRWHVENDQFRELKEGWGLERQRWGRTPEAARGRTTLTCLAFNTAQVYRTRRGARLADRGIRRLRREHRPELGAAPVVIYLGGCYAVLAVEDLLAALGRPVRDSLLPTLGPRPRPP